MVTKTFWLSFCDAERPKGRQFLGVAVVDVTDEDAANALIDVVLKFPFAQEGAEWISAASQKAWQMGCNPSGEMASFEMPHDDERTFMYPRNTLLQKSDIDALEPDVTDAKR